jgi:hypothetical protein
VAGGHRQYRPEDNVNTSPTVSTEGLLAVLADSAAKGHHIASIDVEGTFLECDVDQVVYMRLSKDICTLLVASDRSKVEFVHPDGSICVRIKKVLYGTIQASPLWVFKI